MLKAKPYMESVSDLDKALDYFNSGKMCLTCKVLTSMMLNQSMAVLDAYKRFIEIEELVLG